MGLLFKKKKKSAETCCSPLLAVGVSCGGLNTDTCGTVSASYSREVREQGGGSMCPSLSLFRNLVICHFSPCKYRTVRTCFIWKKQNKQNPSYSIIYSPRQSKGWLSLSGMLFPEVANPWPVSHAVPVEIHSFFIWQLERSCQKRPVRMLLPPEQRCAHTGCHSTACWVIPTALYRARLLNMMFLEWERKGVFLFLRTSLHQIRFAFSFVPCLFVKLFF